MAKELAGKLAELRRRALGQAIGMARLQTSADLARCLEISPDLLAVWERGELSPSLEDVYDMEAALALPHGFLAAAAGYDIRLATGREPTEPSIARWNEPFNSLSLVRALESVSAEGLGIWVANRLVPPGHPFEDPRVEWVATVTSKPPIARD